MCNLIRYQRKYCVRHNNLRSNIKIFWSGSQGTVPKFVNLSPEMQEAIICPLRAWYLLMEKAGDKTSDGVILQLQDYSIHDGDGVRTTVFLAGCGLRCQWCANPESWTKNSQLAFYQHKCSGCQQCEKVCPEGLNPAGKDFVQDDCLSCGKCVSACPEKALQIACSEVSVSVSDD